MTACVNRWHSLLEYVAFASVGWGCACVKLSNQSSWSSGRLSRGCHTSQHPLRFTQPRENTPSQAGRLTSAHSILTCTPGPESSSIGFRIPKQLFFLYIQKSKQYPFILHVASSTKGCFPFRAFTFDRQKSLLEVSSYQLKSYANDVWESLQAWKLGENKKTITAASAVWQRRQAGFVIMYDSKLF